MRTSSTPPDASRGWPDDGCTRSGRPQARTHPAATVAVACTPAGKRLAYWSGRTDAHQASFELGLPGLRALVGAGRRTVLRRRAYSIRAARRGGDRSEYGPDPAPTGVRIQAPVGLREFAHGRSRVHLRDLWARAHQYLWVRVRGEDAGRGARGARHPRPLDGDRTARRRRLRPRVPRREVWPEGAPSSPQCGRASGRRRRGRGRRHHRGAHDSQSPPPRWRGTKRPRRLAMGG